MPPKYKKYIPYVAGRESSSTALSPDEEQRFQKEIRDSEWFKEFHQKYGEEPNLDDPQYDYRKAWKSGVKPERYEYDENAYHWPSKTPSGEDLKSKDHPTRWKTDYQEATGQNPDATGISEEEGKKRLKAVPKYKKYAAYKPKAPVVAEDNSWTRWAERKARGLGSGFMGVLGDFSQAAREGPSLRETLSPYIGETLSKVIPTVSEPPEFGPSLKWEPPTTEDIRKRIDEYTQGRLEPQSPGERIEDKALEFFGASLPLGWLQGGLAGVKAAMSLPGIISNLFAGGTSQALEESGASPITNIIGTTIAGILGHKIAQPAAEVVAHPVQALKELPKLPKKMAAKVIAKTSVYNPEIEASSKRLGIRPLASQLMDNRMLRATETFLKDSAFSGDHYQRLLGDMSEQTKAAWERALESVSPDIRYSYDVSEDALKQLSKNAEIAKANYDQLYEKAGAQIPSDELIEFRHTLNALNKNRRILQNTALNKGQRAVALEAIEEMRTKLTTEATNNMVEAETKRFESVNGKKPTPKQSALIQDRCRRAVAKGHGKVRPTLLMGTKSSINDFVDFDIQGGMKKRLLSVGAANKADIAIYGKKNPGFKQIYDLAEATFGDAAKRLRNDVIDSIIRGKKPEAILQKMNTVSGARRVRDALATNPDGKRIYNSLRRAKLNEMFLGKMVDAEGKVKYQTFATALKDPKKQRLMVELLGPQNYKRVQDLQKFSANLAATSAEFANPSKSGTKVADISAGVKLVAKAGAAVAAYSVSGLAGVVGAFMAPRVMAKLLTNAEFVDYLIEAGKASRAGNMTKVNAIYEKALPLFLNEVRSLSSEEESSQEKGNVRRSTNRLDALQQQ